MDTVRRRLRHGRIQRTDPRPGRALQRSLVDGRVHLGRPVVGRALARTVPSPVDGLVLRRVDLHGEHRPLDGALRHKVHGEIRIRPLEEGHGAAEVLRVRVGLGPVAEQAGAVQIVPILAGTYDLLPVILCRELCHMPYILGISRVSFDDFTAVKI